jgi:hypothetical protein
MSGRSRSAALRLCRPRVVAGLVLVAGFLFAAGPAYADVTSVSGSATGEAINATILGVGVTSGTPTVSLPAIGGGPFTNSVASLCLLTTPCSILKTGLINVSTRGSLGTPGGVTSSASVAGITGLNTLTGGPTLTATTISSSCTITDTSSSGMSTLVGATLGGIALPVNPAPNTTISVPGFTKVVLNEQIPTGGSGNYGLTVNAIDITLGSLLGSGHVIIAQSVCGEAGPDVTIPFAPIGILTGSAILGVVLVRTQRRRPNADDTPPITG